MHVTIAIAGFRHVQNIRVLGDGQFRHRPVYFFFHLLEQAGHGEFGLRPKRIFPFLGQKAVQFGATRFQGLPGGVGQHWDDESEGQREDDK